MKEIYINELNQYLNPMDIRDKKQYAIAFSKDENESNGLTIGWASYGILWKKNINTIYIHKTRYSKHIFDNAQYYSVCYFDQEKYADLLKYWGTVSGKNEDKVTKSNLTVINDELAPYFKESKLIIICKKVGQSDFDLNHVDDGVYQWYQKDGVHTQYYGEIIKVLIDEEQF